MERLQCKKCGHTWIKRIKSPKRCPKCRNYNYHQHSKRTTVIKDELKRMRLN